MTRRWPTRWRIRRARSRRPAGGNRIIWRRMPMLPEQELAAIEARANAATRGPWDPCIFAEGYATAPDERGVHCPLADETHQKPDGTWHTLHICRGMTGLNRVANS